LSCFLFSNVNGQSSDFILLKKKRKTITSFYAGTSIEFVTKNGVYKNASISKIENDTIYIQEFLTNRRMTDMGFYIIDTAGSFHFSYCYKDISTIGRKSTNQNFNVSGSGASLFGGGILLTLASGVVYIADRKKFSPELMIAGAGLAAIGYLLSKINNNGIIIGKNHYRLTYIKMN
jgi:ribose 5-phosphate isomerase